jgi:hypothetical protein
MKRIYKVILGFFFMASLPCRNAIAQGNSEFKPDQYRSIHWDVDDSLPSGNFNTMHKDANGFLWIGSGSPGAQLCRFDGTYFKLYYADKDKAGAINSATIYSFEEDSLHNIWIGTDRGLSRYDTRADTFTNFSPFSPKEPFDWTIAPFWATKNEVFCLEPDGLITAFNIHTLQRRKLVELAKKDDPGTHHSSNKSFYEKSSNSIWFLSWERQNYGRLQQIFLDGRSPKYYTWPCYSQTKHKHTAESQPRHGAEDMRYDPKRNVVWINSGEGLLEFSLADKQFRQIAAFNRITNLRGYDRGVGIDIDNSGRIWLGTYTNGIFVYDPETDEVDPLFTDPYLQQEAGAENLHIYCDHSGIAWVSNWNGKGLYELLPVNPIAKRYVADPLKKESLTSGMISTILPGPQGKLWIGTADGLNIFDPITEKFEVLRAKDLPGIKGTAIIPLYIDTLHQVAWLNAGTQETFEKYFGMRMYEMDLRTRQCRPIVFMVGTKQADRFVVSHTLVRPYEDGIIFCEEKNSAVFELKRGSLIANALILPKSRSGFGGILKVEDRYIFLQHGGPLPNSTFEKISGKWTKIPHLFDSLNWGYLLYSAKEKTYWMSLREELIQYDKHFTKLKSYKKRNGYNGVAFAMQFDDQGNLWILSENKKICRLNPFTGVITTLTEKDGYRAQDYYWFAPIQKDANGNMYFGIGWKTGIGNPNWGLDRIYPERYAATNKASVYLSSLAINQKPIPLPAGINNTEELTLNYKQNTIRIQAGIIDFYAKTRGHIRYKLEKDGRTGDWQYPLDNIIYYEDLQPGSYQLSIHASNASGEYIGTEKKLFIHITPPFWQTWWFRIIAFLVLVDSIYSVVRWRMRQKFKLQLERSARETQLAEMRQRAAELLQQKTELEMQALRAQMNPHFIFNSLNSINRFILQNNKTQASEYLTKFSKLVRLILQNSQASLITLESELEALELYLDLEALRFDHRFGYKISVPKDLDIEVLKVPPLIIQPYTENAIWHGLMHKEDKGQLDIEVSEEGDHLYFKIADNGIGRKQAAAIASKSATKHKSMGLRITQDRIAMLQKVNGESPVKIIDLENADGSAAGTEVIIKMPVVFGD